MSGGMGRRGGPHGTWFHCDAQLHSETPRSGLESCGDISDPASNQERQKSSLVGAGDRGWGYGYRAGKAWRCRVLP